MAALVSGFVLERFDLKIKFKGLLVVRILRKAFTGFICSRCNSHDSCVAKEVVLGTTGQLVISLITALAGLNIRVGSGCHPEPSPCLVVVIEAVAGLALLSCIAIALV